MITFSGKFDIHFQLGEMAPGWYLQNTHFIEVKWDQLLQIFPFLRSYGWPRPQPLHLKLLVAANLGSVAMHPQSWNCTLEELLSTFHERWRVSWRTLQLSNSGTTEGGPVAAPCIKINEWHWTKIFNVENDYYFLEFLRSVNGCKFFQAHSRCKKYLARRHRP